MSSISFSSLLLRIAVPSRIGAEANTTAGRERDDVFGFDGPDDRINGVCFAGDLNVIGWVCIESRQ
jgi:hypothetical protein